MLMILLVVITIDNLIILSFKNLILWIMDKYM